MTESQQNHRDYTTELLLHLSSVLMDSDIWMSNDFYN